MVLPPLLIRADSGAQVGTGHVMRGLALAQAWQNRGGTARFALTRAVTALEERLRAEGMEIVQVSSPPGSVSDAEETVRLAREAEAGWIVVDGYAFGADFQQTVAKSGIRLLVVDDTGHAERYWADLLLNQNIYAVDTLYPDREGTTELLLGTRYAMLRKEFWPRKEWERPAADAPHTVLVTLGGEDAGNATEEVLKALERVDAPGLVARVVVGGSNPHRQALGERVAAMPASGIACELVANVVNMAELMAWADMAVAAAGSTCWELAFMQVPAVLLVLADNQRQNAAALGAAGLAVNVGDHQALGSGKLEGALAHLLGDAPGRRVMAREGRRLVDGEGQFRVAEELARDLVRVRPVGPADRERLFDWLNDPLTRQMSLRTDPIPWAEHAEWFERVTHQPKVLFLIGESWIDDQWVPVGQVRIDGDGTVSISLGPAYRWRGLSHRIVKAAVLRHRADSSGKQLTAFIKPENLASQRLFLHVGFRAAGAVNILGQRCLRYVY